MVVKIYCIEDINDLRYVGSTNQKYLSSRLEGHRCDKQRNKYCSSGKLNLYNCIIYVLEECSEENRKQREQYWIDNTDCVNEKRLDFDKNEWQKEYNQKNKEYKKKYYQENRDKILKNKKEYRKKKWFCEVCQCEYKISSKRIHLKTKKHHLNQKKQLQDFQECSS